MKVQVFQIHKDKNGAMNLRLDENVEFRDHYDNLKECSGDINESFKYILKNKKDLVVEVAELRVEDIEKAYQMTNNITESWKNLLQKGSKYYGAETGCRSTSSGDFMVVDNQDVFLFTDHTTVKLDDNLSKEVINTVGFSNYNHQERKVCEYLNNAKKELGQMNVLYSYNFLKMESQFNDWVYEVKLEHADGFDQLSKKTVDFIKNSDEDTIEYLSYKIAMDKFKKDDLTTMYDDFAKKLNTEVRNLSTVKPKPKM